MSNELTHCPFCGSEAVFVQDGLGFLGIPVATYEIQCTNEKCICHTPIGGIRYHSKESAAKAWNTRYNKGDK